MYNPWYSHQDTSLKIQKVNLLVVLWSQVKVIVQPGLAELCTYNETLLFTTAGFMVNGMSPVLQAGDIQILPINLFKEHIHSQVTSLSW